MKKLFAVAVLCCATPAFASELRLGSITAALSKFSMDTTVAGRPQIIFGGYTGPWSERLENAVRSGERFPEMIIDDGASRYTFKNVKMTSWMPGIGPAPLYHPWATFSATYASYTKMQRAITTPPPIGAVAPSAATAPMPTKKP